MSVLLRLRENGVCRGKLKANLANLNYGTIVIQENNRYFYGKNSNPIFNIRKLILPILLLVFISSCNKNQKSVEARDDNKKFDQYKDRFITSMWGIFP